MGVQKGEHFQSLQRACAAGNKWACDAMGEMVEQEKMKMSMAEQNRFGQRLGDYPVEPGMRRR
jgi:hypothetical protein